MIVLAVAAAIAALPACTKQEGDHIDGLQMTPPVIPAGASGTFLRVGDMIQGRKRHCAVLLPGGDVLVAGGVDGAGQTLASAEFYRYSEGGVFLGAPFPMNAPRKFFSMTPLDSVNGSKVLLCGGENGSSSALDSADLFDPATFKFDPAAGLMVSPRTRHAALRLPNGNVFLCGGANASGVPLASCEIFDPATGVFTRTTADLAAARADHTASLLPSGKVLVAGGTDAAGTAVASAEIFDPGTGSGVQGTFAATQALPGPRAGHVAAPVNLGAYGGQVVLFGGFQGAAASPTLLNGAVVFDPTGNGGVGTFAAVLHAMDSARHGLTATALTGGIKILVAGGNAANTPEIFDPYASTAGGSLALDADFTRTQDSSANPTAMAAVASGRRFHEAVWLLNGTVLLCGGEDGGTVTATSELYNP